MNKLTSTRIQLVLGIVAITFSGMVMVLALQSKGKLEREQIEQTFYVATKGGEAFKVNALHKCGEANMRDAAIQATANQDGPLNFRRVNEMLVAVTTDYARINDGNTKEGTRCEITGIVFTNITGRAYIVEETE